MAVSASNTLRFRKRINWSLVLRVAVNRWDEHRTELLSESDQFLASAAMVSVLEERAIQSCGGGFGTGVFSCTFLPVNALASARAQKSRTISERSAFHRFKNFLAKSARPRRPRKAWAAGKASV